MSGFDDVGGRPAPAAPSTDEMSRFDLNDDGNALRFIRMAGGIIQPDGEIDLSEATVLYLRKRGWIVFNGTFWDLETGEARAKRHAIKVARSMHAQMEIRATEMEAKNYASKSIQAVRDFGVSAGNASRIGNMLNLAASYMDVDIDAFDPDPLALNVQNGVIRFRNGPHRNAKGDDVEGPHVVWTEGHRAADRMTRLCEASYRPDAKRPLFDGVLKYAIPKAENRHWIQKAHGYMATGETGEQVFIVYQGKGGDGKSTVVNATAHALGTYATTVGVETFLDTGVKRGSEASPDIAALAGDSRMLCAGEPPSGSKLATGEIKRFTGGGKIKARELREALFEFEPVGKVVIECNRKPTINDTDNGIWRRLKIMRWLKVVPEDQIDHDLPKKLKREADGILNWLIEGVLAWMGEGLKDVPDLKEALEDYRKGANPFVQWFEDRVIREDGARIGATVLFKDYQAWMTENGHDKAMSQKAFGGTLSDLQIGLGSKDTDGKITRMGARLRTPQDAPAGGSAEATSARAADTGPGPGGYESGGDSGASDDGAFLPPDTDWEGDDDGR